jgi:hypothetical protein
MCFELRLWREYYFKNNFNILSLVKELYQVAPRDYFKSVGMLMKTL